jgi:LysR family transcriptional activator of nhaA
MGGELSMNWLNYHHLLYFWVVAREGSIARACGRLLLSQPTISGQLRALERAVGDKLFDRVGRGLVLTETGREVFRYADEIFALGRELQDMLRDRPNGRPLRLVVGIVDVMPKRVVHRLLEPVFRMPQPVHLICYDGRAERLLAQLALHELDVVLSDSPAPTQINIRAFNHLLGECGISFLAADRLAARYRRGFPKSLDAAPFLLPAEGTTLRRSLEQWFAQQEIRPAIRGEVADTGLIKVFGQAGRGIFAIPTVIEAPVRRQFQVGLVGRTDEIHEQFFAISPERKLTHPAVVAVSQAARKRRFR